MYSLLMLENAKSRIFSSYIQISVFAILMQVYSIPVFAITCFDFHPSLRKEKAYRGVLQSIVPYPKDSDYVLATVTLLAELDMKKAKEKTINRESIHLLLTSEEACKNKERTNVRLKEFREKHGMDKDREESGLKPLDFHSDLNPHPEWHPGILAQVTKYCNGARTKFETRKIYFGERMEFIILLSKHRKYPDYYTTSYCSMVESDNFEWN